MYERIFEFLSKRISSENALSDITWAFAEANPQFRYIFLNFFFDEISRDTKVLSFAREYTRNNCRPDFYIETDKGEYIIECKKYDRSHHFDSYPLAFPKARFGYIANYKITGQNNIELRTWYNLYKKIEGTASDLQSTEDIIFFKSYCLYLKGVCNLSTIKTMKLNHMNSLIHLNLTIRKVVDELPGLDEIEYDGKVKNMDDYRYGKYYGLKKIGSASKIWPWIGVYFNEDRVMLYIEINQEWCSNAFEYIKSLNECKDGSFFSKPYFDDDYRPAYAFELKPEVFDNFNELTDSAAQEEIIKNFITEVLQFIDNHY